MVKIYVSVLIVPSYVTDLIAVIIKREIMLCPNIKTYFTEFVVGHEEE